MIFIKIAILLWVLFFVIGKFVVSGISPAEKDFMLLAFLTRTLLVELLLQSCL